MPALPATSPLNVIDIPNNVNNGQTATLSNMLNGGELVGAVVYGAAGCIATIKKNGVTMGVASYTAGGFNSCTLDDAQTSFTNTDVISYTVSGANSTRLVLHIRYQQAYAFTVTVSIA